ncbi:uncharacterized protein [Coffea arabica]|uniref:SHSP domain-containing protein n=1 Tax=Coffea arabica TaxID=13443 RepID=A0A6P6WIF1_COFAR|nr:inactive protein RESTRICTED TEV MOVEMENT 2-like [Coffea arabica]
MAMRPARGGVGPSIRPRLRPVVQNFYEDFKPMSEWRQDEESDILLLFLPGFMNQHLKVSTEGRNIVRVRGERLVAGNKWSRFQEDYQVPDRCTIRAIRAKFDGGILTMTMPWRKDAAAKATPPKATSGLDSTTDQMQQISPPKAPIEPSSKKSADEIPPKVIDPPSRPQKAAAEIHPKVLDPPSRPQTAAAEIRPKGLDQPSKPQKAAAEIHPKGLDSPSRPQKAIDEIQPKVLAPPSVTADKGSKDIDEKLLSQPQTQKGRQDEQARSPGAIKPVTTSMTISSDDDEKKETITPKTNAKPMKPEYIENLKEVSDGKRSTEKSKEPLDTLAGNLTRKIIEVKEKQSQTAVASSSKDYGLGNFKKAVTSLAEPNEERQLLVNIVVAVLVIVAVGAHIASRIGSEEA